MASFTPTPQQDHCVALVGQHQKTKIDAGAGAAKTSTLALVANEYVVPSLYLAFNKAMVTEAGDRFPSWVDLKTTHSLAYGIFGRGISQKLKRPVGRYVNVCGTGGEIAKYFKIKAQETEMGKRITPAGIGLAIRDTVNNFEYSADERILPKHVSYAPLSKISKHDHFDVGYYVKVVMENAQALWQLRKNSSSEILATHDTYLKLYQLSKPDLSKYEIIYLDEAQDTNDCVLDIIERQGKKNKVVIVGDEFQQIYGFRGSVNAMQKIECATGYLSTSFRFGQAVADLANIILEKPSETGLKGWEALTTQVLRRFDVEDLPDVHTRLYRTNAALLTDAVGLIGRGKRVNLEIDVKDFIRTLESAVELYHGNMAKVKHESLLAYESWADLVEEDNKGELGRIVRLIESGDYVEVMRVLSEHTNTANPEIILTTAHKSKGREWDNVLLADDFPSPYDNEGNFVGLTQMEKNLLYVAVTRAKKLLIMNSTCEQLQDRATLTNKVERFVASEGRAEMAAFALEYQGDDSRW